MSRFRELCFRTANAVLVGALEWLHRTGKSTTTYRVNAEGAAALFEGSWFTYRPREFGATGNIDYAPEAENVTRAKLFSMLEGTDVFYDIGAHGGVYTITLKRRYPELQLFSFEPQPADIRANLKLNDLSDSQVYEVALGAQNGTVRMTTKKRSSNHVSEQGERPVRMVRLDDLRKELQLPAPQWIKIDVEGFELPALRGAEQTLREGRPVIICEINEVYGRFGTEVPDLVNFLAELGYSLNRLTNSRFEPVESWTKFEDLGFSADWNYWFLPEQFERR